MQNIPQTSGIYSITCTGNNKIYVGSSNNLNCRWRHHRGALRHNNHKNTYLQNAFNKYGETAFLIEVIENCAEDRLIEREQYWIDTLNTVKPKGFNLRPRADRTIHSAESRQKMSDALGVDYIATSPEGVEFRVHNMAKFCRKYELNPSNMSAIAKGKATQYKRWRCRYADSDPADQQPIYEHGKDFIVTSPNGIKTQAHNLREFCREHELTYNGMMNVANGRQATHKDGWKCQYADFEPIIYEHIPRNKRGYIITSPDNMEFRPHNLSLFCREHGLVQTSMTAVANGRQVNHYGWQCRYADCTQRNSEKPMRVFFKSYTITSPNSVETITNNLAKFCRENDLDHSNMIKVANGTLKQYKGWKCWHA